MSSASPFLQFAGLAIFWLGLIALLRYVGSWGRLTSVTLLPYQKGVLFKKGHPIRDVGPGKHRVWAGSELIVHGDTRPITVNFEKLIVGLRDGFAALYGFSASVQVRDMRKAIYSARNYAEIPSVVLLRCARRNLNASSANSLNVDRETVAKRIAEEARTRLTAAGFDLISFQLNQLAVGVPQQAAAPKSGPATGNPTSSPN